MANILINEIERPHGAKDDPESCRETFEAINSRIIYLEQIGMKMNANRIWRRMILSKFPKNICATFIQKEAISGDHFEVLDILDAIDDIISLRETTALTIETLLPSAFRTSNHQDTSPKPEDKRGNFEQSPSPTRGNHHLQASGTQRRTNIAYRESREVHVARKMPNGNEVNAQAQAVAHQSVHHRR
ncbi:unnamed protein product, partial [Cylicostephanus goldi]